MGPDEIRRILDDVASGTSGIDEAMRLLRDLPMKEVGSAVLDHHRRLRTFIPEVIFGEGKTDEEVLELGREIFEASGRLLVTRVSEGAAGLLLEGLKTGFHEPRARTFRAGGQGDRFGPVAVVSGGLSDYPVAEEAAQTLEAMDVSTIRVFDVGVAGIHRLMERSDEIRSAAVRIVVAGMEGALPSVVAGIFGGPVVAVPTSVGYGASLGGITPLLGMLSSCAPGIGVVNIDNGFGAASLAASIVIGREKG